jgi:hypothetical protein
MVRILEERWYHEGKRSGEDEFFVWGMRLKMAAFEN